MKTKEDDNLVTLKIYEQYFEASLDQQILEEQGIKNFLANEYTVQNYWLYKQATGGLKLQVFKSDLEKAQNILQKEVEERLTENIKVEYKLEKPKYGNKVCPACRSNHIYRDENLNGVFGLSILILSFPIKLKNHSFHCYYCGNNWKE